MKQTTTFSPYTHLICRTCHKHLSLQTAFCSIFNKQTISGIAQCKCRRYPILAGIVYYYNKAEEKPILYSLAKHNEWVALFHLLESRKRIKVLILLVYAASLFLQTLRLVSRPLKQTLGLSHFLSILQLGGFPGSWSTYLINRVRMPSYILSVSATNMIHRHDITVDVGCGAGHLLPVMATKTDPLRVYGIDRSFFNLLLARIFYADARSILICADIEKDVPFEKHTVDVSISTDCFHYVRLQTKFLNDLSRITKTEGVVALVHILNNKNTQHGNINGLSPTRIRQCFALSHFPQIVELSNQSFWRLSRYGIKPTLSSGDPLPVLRDSYAFSVLAARGQKKLSLCSTQKQRANMTNIYWALDRPLQKDGAVETMCAQYKTFIFISPHLDDAVLSCEGLIKTLRQRKKNVLVISAFTKPSQPPYTPQAQDFMKTCGYTDANRLFNDRRLEDVRALTRLHCQYVHLNYVDAAWRKNTNLTHIYPDENTQFSGHVSRQDNYIVNNLQRNIMSIYKATGQTLIFAPLGIGGHCDHVLVHNAIINLHLPSLFWEDYPYSVINNNRDNYMQNNKNLTLIMEGSRVKPNLSIIKFYETYQPQNKKLFSENSSITVERYYSISNALYKQLS